MSVPAKVALYGGTFDPVHEGHLEIASKAVRQLGLDKIVFVPCRQSPHKKQRPGASDAHRLEMLRLATDPFPWAEIDGVELHRPPPSFTWETVSHYKDTLPVPKQLHLLIGYDQWDKIESWKEIEFIRREVVFVVVGREAEPQSRPGYQAYFIPGNHPASSSLIRSDLLAGRPARWLPEAVRHYIRAQGLYTSPSNAL